MIFDSIFVDFWDAQTFEIIDFTMEKQWISRNPRFLFMEVRASNLCQFFDRFFDVFCYKNRLKYDSKQRLKKTSIFHRFFVVFGIDLETQNQQTRAQNRDLLSKGVPDASGDAPGTNFDAPGRSFWVPGRVFWDSLGTLWDDSGRLGRLFRPSWAHNGKHVAANCSKQQKTWANSNWNH